MSNIFGEIPIGTTGSTFLQYKWVPKPEQARVGLLKFQHQLEDMTAPLEAAKEVFIQATQTNFDEMTDPYGKPWKELTDDYAKWKEAHGGEPLPDLVLNSAVEGLPLKEAALDESSWEVVNNMVVFRVKNLPKYGPAHQSGTGEFGAGDFTGKGKNLPQRMFIGASEAAIEEVVAVFEEWLMELEDEIEWGYNKLGRFPIVGYTSTGQPLLKTPRGIRFGRMEGY